MNDKKFSIVIRNKNESEALNNILSILNKLYKEDIYEVIVIDNNSTDNSIQIAEQHNCRIINIKDFSYGKASNIGINASKCKFVLLLSSHSIPIGNSFFKNSLIALNNNEKIAGIRYINSIENYNRAIKNSFKVIEPLKNGLNTACSIINKTVWEKHKIDENLVFSEDKFWSETVMRDGYEILDLNETFFYFIKRDEKSNLNRIKNETIAYHLMHKKPFPSLFRIIISLFKKIIITNNMNYLKTIGYDFRILMMKLEILKSLE
jgi:glycosyltransferase involved in cell wall biosynthesis